MAIFLCVRAHPWACTHPHPIFSSCSLYSVDMGTFYRKTFLSIL